MPARPCCATDVVGVKRKLGALLWEMQERGTVVDNSKENVLEHDMEIIIIIIIVIFGIIAIFGIIIIVTIVIVIIIAVVVVPII